MITAVLGIIALIIAAVNTLGKDHAEKRVWLGRALFAIGCLLVGASIGWFLGRPDHDGNLQSNGKPTNEASKAQSHEVKIAHGTPPSIISATHKHPTPEYIAQIVGSAAPLSRDKTAEQFIGVPISWDGELQFGNIAGEPPCIYAESIGSQGAPLGMLFRVPIEFPKHNFLLQAKQGTPLHVEGLIEKVEPSYVSIKDAIITLKDD